MPQVFVPVHKMNLDAGPIPGEHSWAIINAIPEGNGGYQSLRNIQATDDTIASTNVGAITGTHVYAGNYAAEKFFVADLVDIYMDGTSVSAGTYSAATAPWGTQFATFGPYVLATNRVDEIQFKDITGAVDFAAITIPTLGATPRASAICVYKNHVILGNIKMNADYGALLTGVHPSLVWWSVTDNAFAYGSPVDSPSLLGTDYKQTFDGDGEVVKLVATDSCVLVFKTKSILRIDGPPFEINLLSGQYGTSHPASVKHRNGRVYFMSDSGPAYVDVAGNQVVLLRPEAIARAINMGLAFPAAPESAVNKYSIGVSWGSLGYGGYVGGDCLKCSTFVDRYSDVVIFHIHSYSFGVTPSGTSIVSTFVYKESSDEFTLLELPYSFNELGGTALLQSIITENPAMGTPAPKAGALHEFFVLMKASGTAGAGPYVIQGYNVTGESLDATYDTHLLHFSTPFKPYADIGAGQVSKIEAVKPIWFATESTDLSPTIRARAYSMTLEGETVNLDNAVVTDSNSTSKDGWVLLENSPSGHLHALAISVQPESGGAVGFSGVRAFIGFIVRYKVGGGRSA